VSLIDGSLEIIHRFYDDLSNTFVPSALEAASVLLRVTCNPIELPDLCEKAAGPPSPEPRPGSVHPVRNIPDGLERKKVLECVIGP
jgi:hypothetical protein